MAQFRTLRDVADFMLLLPAMNVLAYLDGANIYFISQIYELISIIRRS